MNDTKKLQSTLIYAGRTVNREVLLFSSSGGAFTALSDDFLKRGGVVVCSVYNYETHRPEFRLIKEIEERDRARGSKYVQSSMGDIFRKARTWLLEEPDRELLFVGTGCQAEGFRKYVERMGVRDRCTIVDIICHGVPSPMLWREYVGHLESLHRGKVKYLTFKDKRNGWLRPTAYVQIGRKEVLITEYVRFFFSEVPLRPSCYDCPFAKIERETDMTIGDFWHIEEKMPEFYDMNGNSLFLVHTEKGRALFDAIKYGLEYTQSTAAACWQSNLEKPTERPADRAAIWEECMTKGVYMTIVKRYGGKKPNLLVRIVRKIKKAGRVR